MNSREGFLPLPRGTTGGGYAVPPPVSQPEFDLFSYPLAAGFKERGGTSKAAADKIEAKGRAATIRAAVLDLFKTGRTFTADETAARLGESVLSVRPRVSELAARGLIEKTGERRPSSTQTASAVWKWIG